MPGMGGRSQPGRGVPSADGGSTTTDLEALRAGCTWQLDLCRRNGSPIYSALLAALIDRLGVDARISGLLAADGQDPIRSALCLRLFGAVNRLAMREPSSALLACYPTFGGVADAARAVEVFFDFLAANLSEVAAEMRTDVQTNEVGRAAPLSAALNHVTAATGRPLRLLEVGASAGLNLLLDHYYVAADGVTWGPPDSALRLMGHFETGHPPGGVLQIEERRGCDLHPLDVHDPSTQRVLRSFVWPEHVERMQRLDAALSIAHSAPPVAVDAADAVSWVAGQDVDRPGGVTTVLFHSITLPYFSPDERTEFIRTVRAIGEATDEDRPLAWVSFEPSDEDSGVVLLTCESWPQHQRVVLARATPHGLRVQWDPKQAG